MAYTLIIPGLGGSGPEHWQSRWEARYPECLRVRQCNWNIPDHGEWLNALDTAVRAVNEPPLLVAHSLSCALVAHWATRNKDVPIAGAMMVAPADVDDRDAVPAEARVFAPMPLGVLPFPTLVVASTNDSFVSFERAQVFATAWGADFENIGDAGHINGDSHLDDWAYGWRLAQDLVAGNAAMALQV